MKVLIILAVLVSTCAAEDWKDELKVIGYSEEQIDRFEADYYVQKAAADAREKAEGEVSREEARGYKECEPDTQAEALKPRPLDSIKSEAGVEYPETEELTSKGCGYGTRSFTGGKWASTRLDDIGADFDQASQRAFYRLFNYVEGANQAGAKIEMTIPVISRFVLDDDYQPRYGSMHFYLPAEHQDSPPAPLEDSVWIAEFVDDVLYYRAFHWDFEEDTDIFEAEFDKLAGALVAAEDSFYPYLAITLGYTRPMVGRQRYEVMFLSY